MAELGHAKRLPPCLMARSDIKPSPPSLVSHPSLEEGAGGGHNI